MDTRFQGTNVCKVDGKGRVSLPAKFRRTLQAQDAACAPGDAARLYIAYGNPMTDYVECLSGDAYDDLDQRIQSMPEGEEEREVLEILYYSLCDEVQVDDNGRFVLPGSARDKLALDGEAVFQGKGTKFHILKPADSEASKDKLAAMLAKLSEGKEFFNPVSLANAPKTPPVTDNAE
ncbi:cell division/cell wall cluster transcriptional repressor MraZ [Gymnodinialimonas ceratoperidinii]|uniref:Transcriptional regulator MraZ n=2 Tax=Gymnodinialimonas ceratoperidinii TaxID=2856823 RepID=A0A8F6U083_9RHOB|nr:cell division/cell wall cluster transcriptional repressor MraZ [Gymnodinialimonas ceratoperidinii]